MNNSVEIKALALSLKEILLRWPHGPQSSSIFKSLQQFKNHELNSLVFLSIVKPNDLCKLLKTPFYELEQVLNNPIYHRFIIPKKKGGSREIQAPTVELKRIQKLLNYYLQAYYLWIKPEQVHGFVINPHYLCKHCNIVANASQHVGKKYLLNLDLKDFFPGITASRVRDLFKSETFGFSNQISFALTLLTTYQGKLPTGAPTSPALSNFICQQLDTNLFRFSESHHITYSRYADDLSFSSNDPITKPFIEEIKTLIETNNFKINKNKTRLTPSHRKQTVTGITVNEKVNVSRKLLKKTRAMLHDLTLNGLENATCHHFNTPLPVNPELTAKFINRLLGYINFICQVRGKTDILNDRFKNLIKINP